MEKRIKRDSAVTRAKILIEAERLFSEKGFDATSVDEIAKKSNVNKALIYYYFKSKDDILEALFSSAVKEIISMIEEIFEDFSLEESEIERMFDLISGLISQKKKIIKVMYMESLKRLEKNEKPYLFNVADFFINSEVETLFSLVKKSGYEIPQTMDKRFMAVSEFFTGFIPLVNYVIFGEMWSKYFNIPIEKVREIFLKAFRMTHVAYHKSILLQVTEKSININSKKNKKHLNTDEVT
ncbi:MAG: TetR/AcrR family transcriptional regulator [Chitinispirillaceae bacterium]|nr:TetR/AcrR family transcriptional regulator [Chitinispirillaceae bacterium]